MERGRFRHALGRGNNRNMVPQVVSVWRPPGEGSSSAQSGDLAFREWVDRAPAYPDVDKDEDAGVRPPIRSDCKYVVNASKRIISGYSADAEVERNTNNRVVEGCSPNVIKIEAHTDEQDIGNIISEEDQLGNECADRAAKAGARLERVPWGKRKEIQENGDDLWKVQSRRVAIAIHASGSRQIQAIW